ncbi:hypothetical protein C8J56DRAFT_11781 [Mycena floridula]|nr:hypothetical protein C8J56DRAFT_11781 [Mycena floridula]
MMLLIQELLAGVGLANAAGLSPMSLQGIFSPIPSVASEADALWVRLARVPRRLKVTVQVGFAIESLVAVSASKGSARDRDTRGTDIDRIDVVVGRSCDRCGICSKSWPRGFLRRRSLPRHAQIFLHILRLFQYRRMSRDPRLSSSGARVSLSLSMGNWYLIVAWRPDSVIHWESEVLYV